MSNLVISPFQASKNWIETLPEIGINHWLILNSESSLEVIAMDMLKKRCNNIQTMLGKYERTVSSSEKEIRNKLRG